MTCQHWSLLVVWRCVRVPVALRVSGYGGRQFWVLGGAQYRADRGYAYVGVEQTQNELEVRLFSGDERHRGG
jgi:hypothetical protein